MKKKKATKKAATKAVFTITAERAEAIRLLIEQISSFLPISTHSKNATTFESIFKSHNVQKYLKSEKPKKVRLKEGFEKLFRYHKNLPKTIIRELINVGISYRIHKRNPIKKEELAEIAKTLMRLELNMFKELMSIELNEELPKIQVPPEEFVKRLSAHPLVEEIENEPLLLFEQGHFNESVRKAAERFEKRVQKLSGQSDIGKTLMSKSFNIQNPLIELTDLENGNGKGIQEGYMYLTMGMMRGIRNIFSHGDEDQCAPEECFEILLFINWLFRQLPYEK